MDTKRVSLSGWKAVAILAVLAAYPAVRYLLEEVPLDAAGREAVRSWVVIDVKRSALSSRTSIPAEVSAAAVAALPDNAIMIRSITTRGTSDDIVARVEIEVHGEALPSGHSVQYLRLKHSLISGWRVLGKTSAFRYYAKLW